MTDHDEATPAAAHAGAALAPERPAATRRATLPTARLAAADIVTTALVGQHRNGTGTKGTDGQMVACACAFRMTAFEQ